MDATGIVLRATPAREGILLKRLKMELPAQPEPGIIANGELVESHAVVQTIWEVIHNIGRQPDGVELRSLAEVRDEE